MSLAFSQQAMQTKKKIKENRKKTHIPNQIGMPTNQKYNPGFNPHMPNMTTQVNMPDTKKHNIVPQQPHYQNNPMIPQNNINSMPQINPQVNIPGYSIMPNMSNLGNLPNMNNTINPLNPMQNKQMIPQQVYPQTNIPNYGNPISNMNPAQQNMQAIPQMNQMQPHNMNPIPQTNPNPNMGNIYPGAVMPNQMNPNLQSNPSIPQNLNQNQLMYLMGYNQTGYK